MSDAAERVRREAVRRMEQRLLASLPAGPPAPMWRKENVVTGIYRAPDGTVTFQYGFRRHFDPSELARLITVC